LNLKSPISLRNTQHLRRIVFSITFFIFIIAIVIFFNIFFIFNISLLIICFCSFVTATITNKMRCTHGNCIRKIKFSIKFVLHNIVISSSCSCLSCGVTANMDLFLTNTNLSFKGRFSISYSLSHSKESNWRRKVTTWTFLHWWRRRSWWWWWWSWWWWYWFIFIFIIRWRRE